MSAGGDGRNSVHTQKEQSDIKLCHSFIVCRGKSEEYHTGRNRSRQLNKRFIYLGKSFLGNMIKNYHHKIRFKVLDRTHG